MILRLHRLALLFIRWPLLYPLTVLGLALLGAGVCLYYAATRLSIDTSTENMLDANLPFIQKRHQVEQLFPQDKNAILLVVESPVPEISEAAARRLKDLISPHTEAIRAVYLPTIHPFFDRNGLLYLASEELETLASDLARAQPFIARLYEDFSLKSLLELIAKALHYEEQLPVKLDPVALRISDAIEAVTSSQPYRLSWRDLLFEPKTAIGHTLQFVIVSPILDASQALPAEKQIRLLQEAIAQVKVIDGIEVSVKMTGEPVLEYEELLSISHGTEWASAFSLVLVCFALLLGFRSVKLTLATLLTLGLGLAYSLGFATLTVGSLNLISIAFAVLYIGMGVDYATYLALRYREYLLEGFSPQDALYQSLRSVSSALFLCALTTALGMYAFIPTAYRGVSELGIIAGSSMFIVVLLTLTLMPALLSLRPTLRLPQAWLKRRSLFLPKTWAEFPYRHALAIKRLAFFLTLAGLGGLCGIQVDFNPVNLRDPHSESVQTFKQLLTLKEASPMFLTALAEGEAQAKSLKEQLTQLKTVEAAVSVFDLIPKEQEEKLAVIEEIALLLGPQLKSSLTLQAGTTTLADLKAFRRELSASSASALTPQVKSRLIATLDRFIEHCLSIPEPECQQALDQLQKSLLATFPQAMEKLGAGLEAQPFTVEDLPQDLKERWVAGQTYRIDVFPRQDMNVLDNVREFVREVRKIYPEVTGLPVIYLESMQVILNAFGQAFALAVLLITLLLLLILRTGREVFLVLLPLVMGSILTGAATSLLDLPFNYANVISLPLLFGLGVNYGIHMVHRIRLLPKERSVLTTGTARGIFFSALTTLLSFASLGFVSHAGIASMGKLLWLGLSLILLCTFLFLPAFATSLNRQSTL
jgi:hopanoid biosynthesis associated RND transporter like protein HpnN